MRIDLRAYSRLLAELVRRGGVDEAQAKTLEENLTWCDMVGRRNHGIERLPILLERVAAGGIACPCDPGFVRVGLNSCKLDAANGFGHHAGRVAMDRACELAARSGVGVVTVHNTNFFGAGGYYAYLAAERGMIGLALSNSFPKVAAAGGIAPVLGTNPLALAAPRRGGRPVLIDMSTAAVAGSTIREAIDRDVDLAEGIAIDAAGRPITDPRKALAGTLLPAAGAKGYGLAILVELLAGVLSGAGVAGQVSSMYKHVAAGGNNGHFFLALDVRHWMAMHEWYDRVEALAAALLGSGPPGSVRLPGDRCWAEYERSLAEGILIEDHTFAHIERLADSLGISIDQRQPA
ncbi:Ldh family oxidoreductase [Altererythrobacter soli]|uniref:Ldh family oxidoreductase n=1 Tax=Croceibacterium soli TaxID=1739690 RepID=A0A6I4UQW1_9SPHN|nr:Ldh family oxidoreductase [Croceibacterium soli]MXP41380.1 Ldh family oxidoreductase [Croceibacterium soli]